MIDFKKWLLNEELFTKRTYFDDTKRIQYSVYKNPSPFELKQVFHECARITSQPEVGGLIADDGNFYIWGRYFSTHEDMARMLAVNIRIALYIYEGGEITVSSWSTPAQYYNNEEWKKHPAVKRMLGKEEPEALAHSALSGNDQKKLQMADWE